MSAKKVRVNLPRISPQDRAASLQLQHQLEAVEGEIRSSSFKLNRRINRFATATHDYEFKIKMLLREKSPNADYMISRYNQEIEKNNQEVKELEEYAGKLRVLLRETEILKKDLINDIGKIETVRGEMGKLSEMHQELAAKLLTVEA